MSPKSLLEKTKRQGTRMSLDVDSFRPGSGNRRMIVRLIRWISAATLALLLMGSGIVQAESEKKPQKAFDELWASNRSLLDNVSDALALGDAAVAPRPRPKRWVGCDFEEGTLKVSELDEGGAAEEAGVRVGDVWVKFDGQEVKTKQDLAKIFRRHKPGDAVELELKRDSKTMKIQFFLAGKPSKGA